MNPQSDQEEALNVVVAAAEGDAEFAKKAIEAIKSVNRKEQNRRTAKGHPQNRRPPGSLDPYEIYRAGGVSELRARLSILEIEELKDIVAEHGMDRSKLAMKWKTTERLVDLIVDTVQQRAHKGEAFSG